MMKKKMISLCLVFSMIFSICFPNIALGETNLSDVGNVALSESGMPKVDLQMVTTEGSIQVDMVTTQSSIQVEMETDTVANWVQENGGFENSYSPTSGVEWNALGVARYGKTMPANYVLGIQSYFAKYNNMEELKKDFNKPTDFSRIVIGLGAIGVDPEKMGDFNFVQEIYNHQNLESQGVNGVITALIALDTHQYVVPQDARYTRDTIIQMILKEQHLDGSFGWSTSGDADLTGMAIQALSTYYNSKSDVTAAVDRALSWLSQNQDVNGGYISWGSVSAESTAQVICALTSLGKDPLKEKDFIKENGNLITALMDFYNENDGGFKYKKDEVESNSFTSQQVLYCLVSYKRMLEGQTKLYDMSDVALSEVAVDKREVNEENPNLVLTGQEDKLVEVNIPSGMQTPVKLDLTALATSLPSIVAKKDNLFMNIEKDTRITGGTAEINVFANPQHQDNEKLLSDNLDNTKKLDKIEAQFKVGGLETITFDKYITLRIKDMGAKEAAYVDQQGKLHFIEKVVTDQGGNGKNEYCYKDNHDLVIRTKHFTDFIVYSASEQTSPDGGGGTNPSAHVKVKVDASTIGRGTFYSLNEVTYTKGDTPYSVLEKTGLDVSTSGSGSNVYVEGINGVMQFDHGPESGWMYSVNGEYAKSGAGSYSLQSGDIVTWEYTKNLGEDLGDTTSTGGGGSAVVDPEKKPEVNPEVDKNQPEVPIVEEEKIENTYKDFEEVSTWAKEDLKKAVELGIISGYGDTLKPQQAVTRAEFTAMLVRMLKLETVNEMSGVFKDVKNDDWFASSIYTAHQAKIISGVSKDAFMPYGIITREEVAVILQRVVQREVVEAPLLKDEAKISPWAKEAVYANCSNKLMRAENGKFNPKQNVTREMAAILLLRVSESGKLK